MDSLHDSSHRTLLAIHNLVGAENIPPYVANAELLTKEAADKLADTLFADDDARMFPIDTPSTAWLSMAYLLENKPAVKHAEYIEANIRKAAGVHGITADIDKLVDALAPKVEKTADADLYCWVGMVGDKEVKLYPVHGPQGVKYASEYFDANRLNYTPEMRKTIASNIMRKAAQYGVEKLPDSVVKEAGVGLPDLELTVVEIMERARVASPETGVAMAKLALALADSKPGELAGVLPDLPQILNSFDKLEKLAGEYNKRFMNPVDFLYAVQDTEAQAFVKNAISLDKHVYDVRMLSNLDRSIFVEALGEKFAASVSTEKGDGIHTDKLAAALKNLPDEQKAYLDLFLSTNLE